MTSPGIPMIFQGQELLEDKWFHDDDPIDWVKEQTYAGIVTLYSDLIHLRRNGANTTRGLTGAHVNVFHVNDDANVVAFHRWDRGGPRDDVIVVVNVANQQRDDYRIGLPREGTWNVRFNSDATSYSADFDGHGDSQVTTEARPYDGLPVSAELAVGRYAAVVLSQDD